MFSFTKHGINYFQWLFEGVSMNSETYKLQIYKYEGYVKWVKYSILSYYSK